MGQGTALAVQDHPPGSRVFANPDAVIRRHLPEVTPFDNLKIPEKDDNDEKGDGRKGDKISVPSSEIFHPLGVQFHHRLPPFPQTHPLRLEKNEEDLLKKEEEDRSNHPREKGLGEEERIETGIKVSERRRIESG